MDLLNLLAVVRGSLRVNRNRIGARRFGQFCLEPLLLGIQGLHLGIEGPCLFDFDFDDLVDDPLELALGRGEVARQLRMMTSPIGFKTCPLFGIRLDRSLDGVGC